MLAILKRGFVSFKPGNRIPAMGQASSNALDTFHPNPHNNESIWLLRIGFEMRKILSRMNTTVIGHPRLHLPAPAEPVMSLEKFGHADRKRKSNSLSNNTCFPNPISNPRFMCRSLDVSSDFINLSSTNFVRPPALMELVHLPFNNSDVSTLLFL